MQAPSATYSPPCVVCGAVMSTRAVHPPAPGAVAPCLQGCVEGIVRRVERRQRTGPRGPFTAVHLQVRTAHGTCLLMLGERFTYLAAGLVQAPEGVVIRAYHLRRARVGSRSSEDSGSGADSAAGAALLDGTAACAMPAFVTDAESVVVLEPDWLIDVTSLAGTDYCLRQWLADRLAARPETLQKLRGTLVHSLFRALCQDGAVGDAALQAQAVRYSLDLAYLGASTETLLEAVMPHLERLRQWRALFGAELFADPAAEPCYETTLLCPELGLRGRVDLAFRRASPTGPPLVSRVVELKTARYNEDWPDPEFQVRGYYAILASQRRLAPDFHAQVIYTGGAAVAFRNVLCGPEHVRDVLTRRNQAVLALLLGHAPPAGANRCRRSGGRTDCVRLSVLLGLNHCHGRDLQDAATGDGDPCDAEFYAKHYRLLRLEQQATGRQLAALWRTTAAERAAAGAAILVDSAEGGTRGEDGRWRYRVRCENRSELRLGETVLLSDGDPVRGEVAIATLLEVGAHVVELAAMEAVAQPRLIDRYDNGEVLDRIIRALHAWLRAPDEVRALVHGRRAPEPPGLESSARDDAFLPAGGGRHGGEHVPVAVGTSLPPDHAAAWPVGAASRSSRGADAGEHQMQPAAGLNQRQAQALDLALRIRDYLLVQGPPGTGKTHLIACMVRALAARGDRVLLSAWTNQAVDTMLHGLLGQGFDQFARLGSTRSIDPALLPYALLPEGASVPSTPEALARRLRETPVLAATASALADPRINAATLGRDMLILDEAAQLGVAASVGALRLARRFILVGDDQQLPPVVQSEEAARDSLSLSPFALLRPDGQAAGLLVTLTEQYRMHTAIAAWPSEAFYHGALVAHRSVAARRLAVIPGAGDRLSAIADPAMPLVLVDTGPEAGREVALAARAVQALAARGVPASEIGVVAPFRAMVAAVRRLLEDHPLARACTVDTVDRFQGGQREAMVVCLGLDGMGRRGHAFVDDPRRLNVAVTRARAKLVVVGD
ncbi:MAG TPA: AAA domain-containing protein, partial [Chloroflexota bacterium]|nr:AAA domain-containing protein [Chloroflexota bacterium]